MHTSTLCISKINCKSRTRVTCFAENVKHETRIAVIFSSNYITWKKCSLLTEIRGEPFICNVKNLMINCSGGGTVEHAAGS